MLLSAFGMHGLIFTAHPPYIISLTKQAGLHNTIPKPHRKGTDEFRFWL